MSYPACTGSCKASGQALAANGKYFSTDLGGFASAVPINYLRELVILPCAVIGNLTAIYRQSRQIKNRASDGAVFVISEGAFFIGPLEALQKNNRRTSRRCFCAKFLRGEIWRAYQDEITGYFAQHPEVIL